jgi:phospholipase/carboxylesterase
MLHGYGADAYDLFSLADVLGEVLPDTAFAAPNAPEPCDMGGPGFQWFGVMGRDGQVDLRSASAVRAAVPLMAYLQSELTLNQLDIPRLALIGFSQGTMMSLHVGLRMSPGPAAIVGFSGMLLEPEKLAAEKRSTPPILLVHGTADPVVPFVQLAATESALKDIGIVPETVARPGLEHGIDQPGLEAAAVFLRKHLYSHTGN